MRSNTTPITVALSRPNTIGRIVECSPDGDIRERKTLMCDGKLVAVKVGKSWTAAESEVL